MDEKILCMHGGLSPEMERLQQIADLNRPCDVPDVGLMCDLLWSDPDTGVNVSLHNIYCMWSLCSSYEFFAHSYPLSLSSVGLKTIAVSHLYLEQML